MACGVTYAVVPLVRPEAVGSVSGIVGAGGNAGAVLAGFLFKAQSITESRALSILGVAVAISALSALALQFRESESQERVGASLGAIRTEMAD
jgi:NNP family nitrate/nitrite transporter-like MFS transporter